MVIHVDSLKKVEKYLREHFLPHPNTTLLLVVVQEEETDSAQALKLILQLQKEQERIASLHQYEREIIKKQKSKLPLDSLGFDREELVIVEGSALLNVPLTDILSQHYITRSTFTTVARELDLTVKPKVVVKSEGHEIWGCCDLPKMTQSAMEEPDVNLRRLILKTDSYTCEDLSVKMKRTLLRRCHNIRIRTDLASLGLYVVKSWLLKFMVAY